MSEPRAWLYKWNDKGGSHPDKRRNWAEFFDDGEPTEGFGQADGEGGSRLAAMRSGDLLIAYQTDEKAAVGLCRVTGVDHDKPSVSFRPLERFPQKVRLHDLKQSDTTLAAISALQPGSVYALRGLTDTEALAVLRACGLSVERGAELLDGADGALRPVQTLDELVQSVENFRAGASSNPDLVSDLLRRTSLWVYDPATGYFGPGKFVGFGGMTFATYRRAREGDSSGVKFDGHITRTAIEAVLDGIFASSEPMVAQCVRWGQEICGADAFAGIKEAKWKFLVLPRQPNGHAQEREIAKATESIRAGGQGFLSSAEARQAIERRAMHRATEHFTQRGYAVEDVSARECYDLDCRKGAAQLRVEVKGTETGGEVVILTRNEVRLAREHHPHTALVVVHDIRCDITDDGPKATGGTVCVVEPWKPEDADLSAISYECRVPQVRKSSR